MRGVKRKKRGRVCACPGAGVRVYHPACLFVSGCAHPPVCEFVAVSVCICCHSVSVSACVRVCVCTLSQVEWEVLQGIQ